MNFAYIYVTFVPEDSPTDNAALHENILAGTRTVFFNLAHLL